MFPFAHNHNSLRIPLRILNLPFAHNHSSLRLVKKKVIASPYNVIFSWLESCRTHSLQAHSLRQQSYFLCSKLLFTSSYWCREKNEFFYLAQFTLSKKYCPAQLTSNWWKPTFKCLRGIYRLWHLRESHVIQTHEPLNKLVLHLHIVNTQNYILSKIAASASFLIFIQASQNFSLDILLEKKEFITLSTCNLTCFQFSCERV